MLVLTRKEGEEIQIGTDIRIRVLRIRGGQIRVGISAPREVRIIRSELTPTPNSSATSNGTETAAAQVTAAFPVSFQAAATPESVAAD
ncbi:MAG: carbon storage regulator [Maioricimonas sp. JB049]